MSPPKRMAFAVTVLLLLPQFLLAQFNADDQQRSGADDSHKLLTRAQSGSVRDQLLLGEAYATGFGLPKDLKQAVKWFHRAADTINNLTSQSGRSIVTTL